MIEIVDGLEGEQGAGDPILRAAGFDEIEFYHALWTLTNVCYNLERTDAFAVGGRALREGAAHIGATEEDLADYLRELMEAVQTGAWSHAEDAMATVGATIPAMSANATRQTLNTAARLRAKNLLNR